MPIQPGLALQVKGLELPDPLAMQSQAIQMQNALQQQRMGEMQIQNAMREQQRKQRFESTVAGFQPGMGINERVRALQAQGLPNEAMQFAKTERELEEQRSKAETARLNQLKAQAELTGRFLTGVKENPSLYPSVRQQIINRGLATADEIPEQYDPTFVDRMLRSSLSVKDQADIDLQTRKAAATEMSAGAAASQAETARAKLTQDRVPAAIQEFRAVQAMPEQEREAFTAFQANKRPQTTINMQQESALRKELGQEQGKMVADGFRAAEDAIASMDTINIGRDLLNKGVITGFGADFLVNAGQALKQVGIDLNSDAAANAQTYAATLAGNVGRLIKLFGAGTGLSNADREYAEKMAGGKISLDERALRRILDINERSARNVITKHNANVDRFKAGDEFKIEMPPERASNLPPRDQEALNWARSNPTDPRSAQILKRLGVQ